MFTKASDFFNSLSKKEHCVGTDLFTLLTNYRRVPGFYPDELKTQPLFLLYLLHKIPFDLDVLRLFPQYKDQVEYIETWNHYLTTGKILKPIPNVLSPIECIVFDKRKTLQTGKEIDADRVCVAMFANNREAYQGLKFYSGGFPLPGMLSYYPELFIGPLPLIKIKKELVFVEFLNFHSFGKVEFVSQKEKTLEEVKLTWSDTLVFEAQPYLTTKEEYILAYVLCQKKLVVVKEAAARKELIQSWLS